MRDPRAIPIFYGMMLWTAANKAAFACLIIGIPGYLAAETGSPLGGHPNQPAFLGGVTTPPSENPFDRTFGGKDPVRRSLGSTEDLTDHVRQQQHRFQANGDRREVRPRRPEPGEVEVTREDDTMPIHDPLRRTLRSLLPRTP